MLSVFLNNLCNLDCRYCYAKGTRLGGHRRIDLEFAKTGIRDYFSQGHNQLRFFSTGEPTLEFELIKQIYEFATETAGSQLVTEIQTNGVMTDEKARWIAQNINNVWLSCDGPPDVQDAMRPVAGGKPSSPIVERTARAMVEEKRNVMKSGFVGARVTISTMNIHRQQEIVDYFKSLGIRFIYSDAAFLPIGSIDMAEPYAPVDIMLYCKEFLEANRYAKEQDMFYGSFYIINFDGPCQFHCRSCLPTPHLTYDGLVSCCDMAYSSEIPEPMKRLVYGHWDNVSHTIVYDEQKEKHITTRRVENLPACKTCSIGRFCGGYCIGEVLNETGDFYGILPERCKAIRYLALQFPVGNMTIPVLHP